jgi:lia operon protein LiaG
MKKLIKLSFILLFIGICGTVATASMTDVFSFETVNLEESNQIDGKNIREIDVKTTSTNINIVPTKGENIEVSFGGEVSKRLQDKYELLVDEKGERAEIEVRNKDIFFYIGIPVIRLTLDIAVPEKTYDKLVVSASSGDIALEQLEATNLIFHTSSGDMKVSNIMGENIKSEASSGTITMEDSEAHHLQFQASSGDVKLQNIRGDIQGVTSSGSIELLNEIISGNLQVEASSGNVNVEFTEAPQSVVFDFQGSSGKADIQLDGVTYQEKSENRMIGKIGNGEYEIKVRTSSGDFRLN